MTTIIRLPEVIKRTGKCRASIYADIKKGLFPPNIPIGIRSRGWIEEEIEQWIQSKIVENRDGQ